jgi:hypothetical protein
MNFGLVELIPVLHRNVNIGDADMEPSLLSFWRDRRTSPDQGTYMRWTALLLLFPPRIIYKVGIIRQV